VKISEVNTKQYQKPKKVGVNEADKYNHDVQDYDIYENQVWIHVPQRIEQNCFALARRDNPHASNDVFFFIFQAQLNKNKFRISDGQQFR